MPTDPHGVTNEELADRLIEDAAYDNKTKVQVKLVTDCGMGSRYVDPERIEVEDDGSLTIVVKAWSA